jgi:hypothetical protein
MLEQTLRQLDPASSVARQITQALSSAVLPKPEDHRGDSRTDMMELMLNEAAIRDVVNTIQAAKARSDTHRFGGYVEAWQEYLSWQTNKTNKKADDKYK